MFGLIVFRKIIANRQEILNIKTLIKILKKAVNELLTLIDNLDFKDTVIPNEPLADNDGGLFSLIALKLNRLKISTFNINVDYN
jgi:hypothetical protein